MENAIIITNATIITVVILMALYFINQEFQALDQRVETKPSDILKTIKRVHQRDPNQYKILVFTMERVINECTKSPLIIAEVWSYHDRATAYARLHDSDDVELLDTAIHYATSEGK